MKQLPPENGGDYLEGKLSIRLIQGDHKKVMNFMTSLQNKKKRVFLVINNIDELKKLKIPTYCDVYVVLPDAVFLQDSNLIIYLLIRLNYIAPKPKGTIYVKVPVDLRNIVSFKFQEGHDYQKIVLNSQCGKKLFDLIY